MTRRILPFCAALAGLFVLSCDDGAREDDLDQNPPLALVGINVGTSTPLRPGAAIELSFDRLLKPSSVVRQSFAVRDAFGEAVDPPVVTYDPVTRVVRIASPKPPGEVWLKPDQPYILVLGVPRPNEELGGFRAIDDSPMDANARRVFGFQVRGTEAPPVTLAPVDYCRDIKPLFAEKCLGCHSAGDASGLDLATPAGIAASIGRIAREASRGPSARTGTAPGRLFGPDMPILDAGNASNSFLLYKVLLNRPGTGETKTCGPATVVSEPGVRYLPDPGDAERARLGARVFGQPMPPPPAPGLTDAERRRLSAWIAGGAKTDATCNCAP